MLRSEGIIIALALMIMGANSVAAAPKRVVSMNLCTDQLLMLLADPDQIVSLSKIADDPYSSPMADQARAYPKNTGSAEQIFLTKPDLVVAGLYTEKASVQMLQSLGVQVEIFEPEQTFDDLRARALRMGELLGHPDRAEKLVADFDARLAQMQTGITQYPRAALYYANGYTTGDETLAGHILNAAGFKNIASEAGITWGGTMPLETLVMLEPDLVVSGTVYPGFSRSEEILRHPALTPLKIAASTDANWVCGTPKVLDAIAELQRAHPDKGAK